MDRNGDGVLGRTELAMATAIMAAEAEMETNVDAELLAEVFLVDDLDATGVTRAMYISVMRELMDAQRAEQYQAAGEEMPLEEHLE